METYFNIRYEFDSRKVHDRIARQIEAGTADYICVADGVIMNTVNRDPEYMRVVNSGMFSICDSSYVPLYIRWIHHKSFRQYCGSQIFLDVIRSRRYRMIFLGTSLETLNGLRENLLQYNPDVMSMTFCELPFKSVEAFDYPAIAKMIEADGAQIVWVALGAPKQEIFMYRLKPHLAHGVMIAVGAAFKFHSGLAVKRAPQWMIQAHLEFLYRILCEPRKQLKRCGWIIITLPRILLGELRRKWQTKYDMQMDKEALRSKDQN